MKSVMSLYGAANVYDQTGVMLDKTVSFFSFLERYADERESLEQGFSNEDRFNHWFETEL